MLLHGWFRLGVVYQPNSGFDFIGFTEKRTESTMGLLITFINIVGAVFIMGGGQLSAMSSWVNNYWIYFFTLGSCRCDSLIAV